MLGNLKITKKKRKRLSYKEKEKTQLIKKRRRMMTRFVIQKTHLMKKRANWKNLQKRVSQPFLHKVWRPLSSFICMPSRRLSKLSYLLLPLSPGLRFHHLQKWRTQSSKRCQPSHKYHRFQNIYQNYLALLKLSYQSHSKAWKRKSSNSMKKMFLH